MDLVPGPFSASTIAALEAVSVVDITSPTELNSLAGTVVGERRVCYQVSANDNPYTTYFWDSADGTGASSPYVVAGSAGFWIAAGGRYTNSAVSLRSTLLVSGAVTLSSTLGAGASTLASLVVTGAASVGTTLGVTGAATLSSTLGVSGATTLDLGSGADPATALSGTVLTARNADATNVRILGVAYGANGIIVSGRGVAGTRALPTATTSGQVLCQFTGFGYNGTTYPTSSSALYGINAGSLWTASNQETLHEWRCTPNGSTTNTQRMVLYGTGNLCLGSAPADDGTNQLQVAGPAKVTGATTLSSTLAVSGITSLTNATASTSTSTGALVVTGGAGIGGAIFAGSTITGTKDGDVATLVGSLVARNATNTSKNIIIGVSTSDVYFIQSNLNGTGSRPLTINSGGGNVLIGTTTDDTMNNLQVAGSAKISSTTVSSSTTTGALIVAGGLGVAGAINVGGALGVTGAATFSSTIASGAVTSTGRLTGTELVISSTLGYAEITRSVGGNYSALFFRDTSNSKYNWAIGSQIVTDDAFQIVPSTAAGGGSYTTPALRISGSTGNATFSAALTIGSATLITTSVAFTNGAAAQVATMTNGPTAGNPTKWIPVNDNGTTRYIPAW
jgi:fibronectin-binding autotransporter adhesin